MSSAALLPATLVGAANRSWNGSGDGRDSPHSDPFLLLSVVLFLTVDIIGVVANVFVLVVLLRNDSKQVYEVFCTGLALTDLLFLTLTVPITTFQYVMDAWLLGAPLCKFTFFVVTMTVYSSAIMLLGLTCSRFLAVVHPWENRKINPIRAKAGCLIAWIFGALLSIPQPIAFVVEVEDGIPICRDSFALERNRVLNSLVILLFSYMLPFFAMLIMNCLIVRKLKREDGRPNASDKRRASKRRLRTKVTKMVMLVTLLYGICWLPTELINFWYNGLRHLFPMNNAMLAVKICATALHYASCCVNPIVYSMLSGSFKAAIVKQFPSMGRRLAAGSGAPGVADDGVSSRRPLGRIDEAATSAIVRAGDENGDCGSVGGEGSGDESPDEESLAIGVRTTGL